MSFGDLAKLVKSSFIGRWGGGVGMAWGGGAGVKILVEWEKS